MCFSIPLKVTHIQGGQATVEGGRVVRLDDKMQITKGDFVQITGDLIVDKITRENGLKIRRMIKRLNS